MGKIRRDFLNLVGRGRGLEKIEGIGKYKGTCYYSYNTYQDIIVKADDIVVKQGEKMPELTAKVISNGGPLDLPSGFEWVVQTEEGDTNTVGMFKIMLRHKFDTESASYVENKYVVNDGKWFMYHKDVYRRSVWNAAEKNQHRIRNQHQRQNQRQILAQRLAQHLVRAQHRIRLRFRS